LAITVEVQIKKRYFDPDMIMLLRQLFTNVHFFNLYFGTATAEAEFLDVIGTKVLRVFLLPINSHLNGFYKTKRRPWDKTNTRKWYILVYQSLYRVRILESCDL
jgi:hypothetical protein